MTPWAVINPARLAGSGLLRTQSDSRLVDLVRAGNDRAFEAIVLRYHRPLLRHCRRLLPAGRAEDAVQQALLRALEAMRADDRELQLGPWLHRIAHNTAIDSLRRMDSHWEELDERMDGVEPTHAAVERRARFDSVMSNMGELPERQRRALVLRELEGRSYDEIAVALGATGDGVRQLLNRARNSLRAAASALVPPALVGRIAGSQAGVRIAELTDPPTSALMAKATAAVAAGAVALFAVTGPPSGDGGKVTRAEAAEEAPAAAQDRPEAGTRPDGTAASADPVSGRREPGKAGPRSERGGDGKTREQKNARRGAAGPGSGSGGGDGVDGGARRTGVPPQAGGGDDDDAPAGRRGGGSDDDDDDAPATRQGSGSDDDDDGAPAAGAPAGGDDGASGPGGGGDDGASAPGGGEDGGEPGTLAAAPAPPPDDGGDGSALAAAPPLSGAQPAAQPQTTLADEGGAEAGD
jgi:RNA polymerase sigma factor (sigma-70 family)